MVMASYSFGVENVGNGAGGNDSIGDSGSDW